jgi:hypothetical protein
MCRFWRCCNSGRQHGSSSCAVVDEVYGPDLPDEELSAAVGADALDFGAESTYASDAGCVLHTQMACRLEPSVQRRILLDSFSMRPQSLQEPAILGALCHMQMGCFHQRFNQKQLLRMACQHHVPQVSCNDVYRREPGWMTAMSRYC